LFFCLETKEPTEHREFMNTFIKLSVNKSSIPMLRERFHQSLNCLNDKCSWVIFEHPDGSGRNFPVLLIIHLVYKIS